MQPVDPVDQPVPAMRWRSARSWALIYVGMAVAVAGSFTALLLYMTDGYQWQVPLVLALLGLVLAALGWSAPTVIREQQVARRGLPAIATVERATTVVDNPTNPLVETVLQVRPVDGSASFFALARTRFPAGAVPAPGAVMSVRYDPKQTRLVKIDDPAPAGSGGSIASPPKSSVVDEIERLAELRRSGSITDEEFEKLKKRVIEGTDSSA